mgnify:CR=1 FL=1
MGKLRGGGLEAKGRRHSREAHWEGRRRRTGCEGEGGDRVGKRRGGEEDWKRRGGD